MEVRSVQQDGQFGSWKVIMMGLKPRSMRAFIAVDDFRLVMVKLFIKPM